MFATTFALLNSAYAGRDRGSAYGIWGAVAGASAAVGPILGGLLTAGASWPWIFFVNLPVSAIAIMLCVTTLADAHAPARGRVDIGGMASFTATAACATYALIRANEDGWSTAGVWWLLVLAAVLLAVFAAFEANTAHPMLDLALLRNRSFVGVLLAGFLLTFAAFAAFTYTSIWLQSVPGLSPLGAGLTSLPMSITAFGVSAVLGRVLHGRRPDLVIGAGLLFIGLGGLLTAVFVHGSAGWPALMPGFAVIGIGVGLATPILGSARTRRARRHGRRRGQHHPPARLRRTGQRLHHPRAEQPVRTWRPGRGTCRSRHRRRTDTRPAARRPVKRATTPRKRSTRRGSNRRPSDLRRSRSHQHPRQPARDHPHATRQSSRRPPGRTPARPAADAALTSLSSSVRPRCRASGPPPETVSALPQRHHPLRTQ
jgi:MFS family permease